MEQIAYCEVWLLRLVNFSKITSSNGKSRYFHLSWAPLSSSDQSHIDTVRCCMQELGECPWWGQYVARSNDGPYLYRVKPKKVCKVEWVQLENFRFWQIGRTWAATKEGHLNSNFSTKWHFESHRRPTPVPDLLLVHGRCGFSHTRRIQRKAQGTVYELLRMTSA